MCVFNHWVIWIFLIIYRSSLETSVVANTCDTRNLIYRAYVTEGDLARLIHTVYSRADGVQSGIDKDLVRLADELTTARSDETVHNMFLDHPLNLYRFLQRSIERTNPTFDKIEEEEDLSSAATEIDRAFLDYTSAALCWPEKIELNVVINRLVDVVNMYDIPISDLINGRIVGQSATNSPSFDDILEIVTTTYARKMLRKTTQWCQFLLKNFSEQLKPQPVYRKINRMLAGTYYLAGNVSTAIELLHQYADKYPRDEVVMKDKLFYEENIDARNTKGKKIDPSNTRQNRKIRKLCNSQFHLTTDHFCDIVRPLKGWYPLRREHFSKNPNITLLHNVIADSEAKLLMDLSIDDYGVSVMTHLDKYVRFQPLRDSHGNEFPLEPAEEKDFTTIWKTLTNLQSNTIRQLGDKFNVIYAALHDKTPIKSKNIVYRTSAIGFLSENPRIQRTIMTEDSSSIATFYGTPASRKPSDFILSYVLQSPNLGGNTYFEHIGVSVPTIKGSALLVERNTKSQAEKLRSTRRECPIALGAKIVAVRHEEPKAL